MALVVKDRVKETTTTTGTGTITLAGAAYGFQAFSVLGNGSTTYYAIYAFDTGDWEVGLGTYTLSGTTLARTTVLSSSNSGSAVNFGSGLKEVFVTYPAERAVIEDIAGNIAISDNITFADNAKAIFGAGSDLQIYHTGSHSWVQDAGTGNLYVAGDHLWLTNSDNTKQFLKGDSTGRVDLYYGTSVKLATTSTGVEVTGTVVADGFQVGNTESYFFANASGVLDQNGIRLRSDNQLHITVGNATRQSIASNGDVSFYEDTGTTPKFVWDSSDESLLLSKSGGLGLQVGINDGTVAGAEFRYSTVPAYITNSVASGPITGHATFSINRYDNTDGTADSWSSPSNASYNSAAVQLASDTGGSEIRFFTEAGEAGIDQKMVINSAGNVNIGTSGANYRLAVEGANNLGAVYIHGGTGASWGLEIGSHTAGTESDLVLTDNAVIGSQGSLSFVAESTGYFAWRTGGTSHKTGTAGSTERVRITSAGELLVGTTSNPNGSRVIVRGGGTFNNTFTQNNSTVQIISDEMSVSGQWYPTFNIAMIRQSLTTGSTAFGGIGFSTIDDSNSNGMYDAGRIAIVNENGAAVSSGTAMAFYTQVGSATYTNPAEERVRITSAGTLLVATATSLTNAVMAAGGTGFEVNATGLIKNSRTNGTVNIWNRNGTDGDISVFFKDGATVGSIGTFSGDLTIGDGDIGIRFDTGTGLVPWNLGANSTGGLARDAAIDIGASSARFKDLYLSGIVNAGGGNFTGTSTAATFNATSTSGGGFQGIDADSAAAPSFTWSADLNTGIYRSAADAIGFTAGGVVRAEIRTEGLKIPTGGIYNSVVPQDAPINTLTLTAGGSGFTNGTYSNVGINGGTYGLMQVVVAGGTVTSVTLTNPGYAYEDGTFDCSSTLDNVAGAGTGFTVTVAVEEAFIHIYAAPGIIRFTQADSSSAVSQEIGSIRFAVRDAGTNGSGDTARIVGRSRSTSGGGELMFQTTNNGGGATLKDTLRLQDGNGLFYNTASAATFNATSTSGGGFQGIDADSATTPSFTWSADLDTGMYRTTTNAIGFTTAGVLRLTINSTGTTAVGTSTAATFNATSTTGGGFQGIDADSAAAPSFTWSADLNTGIYRPSADQIGFTTAGVERGRFDNLGNLAFNSGYGSVATAYGCRAWVNFNGTGTVAIRGSGNVSSISDTGVGNYVVNFTTAMSDTNYARCVSVGGNATTTGSSVLSPYNAAPTTASLNIVTFNTAFSGTQDCNEVNVSIFR